MLTLVLTREQTVAVSYLNFFGSCPHWRCSYEEWKELIDADYCWRDCLTYRAHETYATPGFQLCEPDAKGISTEAGDNAFEDSANGKRLIESGWMQR